MRFMILVKATADSEAGVLPTEAEFAAMGQFNEELVKAGVMEAGEGLHPSRKGARVQFSGASRRVSGPRAGLARRSLSRKAPISASLRVQTTAATIDPPLAPDMIAGSTPSDQSALTTPIWVKARAPPPAMTTPTA